MALALIASSAACRDPAGPQPRLEHHWLVFGAVEVGSAFVQVIAREVAPGGLTTAITGVTASVTGPGGTTPLTDDDRTLPGCMRSPYNPDGDGEPGCYTTMLPDPVRPGDTFELSMDLPDGGVVSGRLSAPSPPVASIPADSHVVTVHDRRAVPPDRLPIAVVPIVVTSSAGATRIEVTPEVVGAVRPGEGGATIDPRGCTVSSQAPPFRLPNATGTHDLWIHEVRCVDGQGFVAPWGAVDLSVHVSAMDENYAAYADGVLEGSSVASAARGGFGIEGAVGVFGAIASVELPLRLVYVQLCTYPVGCAADAGPESR